MKTVLHVLIAEYGPETVGFRRYAEAVVAVGLHGMDSFPRPETQTLGTHSGDGQ